MRIDLNSASLPELDRSTNTASTSTAASKVPPNAVGPRPVTTDVASFSSGAEGLSHLKAKLEGVPEVRQQRVDQLRSALAQGNYPISPEHIAQAMLADAVRKLG